MASDGIIAAGDGYIAEQGDEPGFGIVDAVIAAGDVGRGRDEDIAQGVDTTDPRGLVARLGRPRGGARPSRVRFCRWYPERGPGRLGLVLGHVGGQYVGADAFNILFYRDGIAAGDRDLLLVVPFEAVTRGHHIGCSGELYRLACHDAHLLIDIPNGLVADHGLRLTFDGNMTVRIEAVDLGVAPLALVGAVMGGERVGRHLGGAPLGHGVPSGDVDLRVLLPLDARCSRDSNGSILGSGAKAEPLSGDGRRACR